MLGAGLTTAEGRRKKSFLLMSGTSREQPESAAVQQIEAISSTRSWEHRARAHRIRTESHVVPNSVAESEGAHFGRVSAVASRSGCLEQSRHSLWYHRPRHAWRTLQRTVDCEVSTEPPASGQSPLSHLRHSHNPSVAGRICGRVSLSPSLVGCARSLRSRMAASVHRTRIRRETSGVLPRLALSIRWCSLVVGEDQRQGVGFLRVLGG